MPNQPATPAYAFRVPKRVMDLARKIAAERGETVSDVVRRALEEYVKDWPGAS